MTGKRTDQINPSDFFQDLALSLRSERSIGKAKNIVDFLGTELDQEKWGVELCREQVIPLKVFYGIELDSKDRDILEQWKIDEKTTWEPLDTNNYQGLVLEGGRRSGKCDANHTFIYTERGLCQLKEFVGDSREGDFVPLNLWVSSGTNHYSFATHFYNNGTKQVSELKTKLGYDLAGVPEHRVKIINKEGNLTWRYFRDLQIEDFVALSKSPNIWSREYYSMPPMDVIGKGYNMQYSNPDFIPTIFNETYSYLMGLLFGDGTLNSSNIEITGLEKDINEYKNLLVSGLPKASFRVLSRKEDSRVRKLVIGNTSLKNLFKYLGYKSKDRYSKAVLDCIFKSPKSVVAKFLRGLFDTDGYISKDGKQIEFYSACRQLSKDVQLLLLNFGIVSSINSKQIKGYENDYYTLRLIGLENRRIFAREIGFGLSRKAKRLLLLDDSKKEGRDYLHIPHQKAWCRYLRDYIPIARGELIGSGRNGFKGRKKADRAYRKELKQILGNVVKTNSKEELSYSRLNKLLRWMEETGYSKELPDIYDHFKQFEDTDYFYDQIVCFQEYETETGDLVVPEDHTYTANGIISHNSTVSSLIIAYEFYKLVMEPSPQAKYGISRNSPISILAIATTATQTERTIFKQVRGVIPLIKSLNRMVEQGEIFIGKKAITHEEKMVYIYPGNSESSGQVGQNVLCLVMDEVARFAVDSEGNSNAETIWSNIGLSGMTFGTDAKRIALSSAWEQGDAIEKLYTLAEDEDSFVGFRLKSWDMNPKKASRDNPVVRAEYSLNPLKAALEFEGKRLTPLNRFLDKENIRECFRGRSQVRYIDQESDDKLIRKKVTKVESTNYSSVAHIDPAVVRDSYALAIGHAEKDEHNRRLVVIDCMMAWHPQPGYQVSVTNVQEAILEIHQKRFIQKLTSDHHQNTETIQRLKNLGINSEGKFFGNKYQLMIYEQLRFLINEGRLILPKDSPVKELAKDELNQLEIINATKIDHPKGGCFTGDTLISLVDKTLVRIKDLVNRQVEVYSSSPEGRIVYGKAKARVTKLTRDLMEIMFDNKTVVKCTPDHRFMLRDGNYIQARAIIPYYTELRSYNPNYYMRVVSKKPLILKSKVPVYDLEVDDWHNFALGNGVIVHNSKDLADAIASVAWHLTGDESIDDSPIVLSTSKGLQEKQDPRSLGSPLNDESDFLKRGQARLNYFRNRKGKGAYFG